MTTIKSHARRQTTAVDGTLIDGSDRVADRRYYVYTYYTCYARVRTMVLPMFVAAIDEESPTV